MKKNLLFITIFLICWNSIFAQGVQQRNWFDGDPLFNNFFSSKDVIVDSTVRLIPQKVTQAADSFRFILYGEDMVWPIQKFSISAAYDIDYLSEKNKNFYLVCDGFGRRVFEVNYTDPNLPIGPVFSYIGLKYPLINPVDASIFYRNGDRKILVTDNGGNRVIEVDRLGGNEEWVYGDGSSGRGYNQLSGPSDAIALPDTNYFLICDQGNNRVIFVERETKNVIWSYGEVGQFNPVDIELDTINNAMLVTDKDFHQIVLLSLDNRTLLWRFGTRSVATKTDSTLNSPTDADILANGNILICDAGNERLLEVNSQGTIVWRFDHRPLMNLRDADRLPDNRTIIVADYPPLLENIPIWLGYTDSVFTSSAQLLDNKVNIDSIMWSAQVPPGTEVKLQLRSAENQLNLLDAPWRGPTETDSFFVSPVSAVNSRYHQGHNYYQFRAILKTNSPLNTPRVTDFQIRYHYYGVTAQGTITSSIIDDTAGVIISGWQNLSFRTQQFNSQNVKVGIIDAATGVTLKEFFAETIDTVTNTSALSIWNELKGKQSIRLRATLTTSSSSTTPSLDNWKVEWTSTMSTASQIQFVNANYEPVTHYRTSTIYPPKEELVDQVFVRLVDLNLASVLESITLQIQALRSNDVLDLLLEQKPDGRFEPKHGTPIVVFVPYIPNNTFLEVYDRDTLIISYTDPTNPADQSSDTVLVIQNSVGVLQVVNSLGASVDTFAISDSMYIYVNDEYDQNISNDQDTIWVDVIDNSTQDLEQVPLIEVADSIDHFSSGNFRSAYGLRLIEGAAGINNDGLLQTMYGDELSVKYVDNVTLQRVIYVLQIPGPDGQVQPSGLIDFAVAPNPYKVHEGDLFRLRVGSSVGNLIVERMEIYNLAGHKVRTINGSDIVFDVSTPINKNTFARSSNWWNLKNEGGDNVASGTYWIRMYAAFADGSSSDLTALRKFIIIR